MPQLQTPFNASQYQPQFGGGGQLPVGQKMLVVAFESEIAPTKDGQNGKLVYNLRIIEGEFTGQTGKLNLNLYHSNQQTVDIANKQLSAICHVTGVFNLTQTELLHDKPFRVDVRKQANDDKYTEVFAIYDAYGNEPGKQASSAPAQPAQQQGGFQQGQGPAPAPAPAQGAWGGGQNQAQGGFQGGGQAQAPAQPPAQAWGGQQQTAQTGAGGGGFQGGGAAPWGQR